MEMNTLAIYGPYGQSKNRLEDEHLQPTNHPILESSSSGNWKDLPSDWMLFLSRMERIFPSSPGSWLDPFSPQNVDAHPVCSAELNRENFPSSIFPSQPQPSISLCKCFTCSGLDSKGWRAACKVRRLGSKDSLVITYPTYGPPKSNRSSTKPFLGGEEIEEIIYIYIDSLLDEKRSGASLHIASRSSRSRCSMNKVRHKSPTH